MSAELLRIACCCSGGFCTVCPHSPLPTPTTCRVLRANVDLHLSFGPAWTWDTPITFPLLSKELVPGVISLDPTEFWWLLPQTGHPIFDEQGGCRRLTVYTNHGQLGPTILRCFGNTLINGADPRARWAVVLVFNFQRLSSCGSPTNFNDFLYFTGDIANVQPCGTVFSCPPGGWQGPWRTQIGPGGAINFVPYTQGAGSTLQVVNES